MFDRKNIALEVLSNCDFLSSLMRFCQHRKIFCHKYWSFCQTVERFCHNLHYIYYMTEYLPIMTEHHLCLTELFQCMTEYLVCLTELPKNVKNTNILHTAFKQPRSCKKQFRGSVKSIKSSSQKYFNDINQKIFGWETFEQTQSEHFWLSCIPKSPHIQRSQIVFEFCAQVSKYKFQ